MVSLALKPPAEAAFFFAMLLPLTEAKMKEPNEFAGHVPCPAGCNVVFKSSKGPIMRKGEDYDSYFYDVVDSQAAVVSSYEVRDSMSSNPPFEKSVRVVRLD